MGQTKRERMRKIILFISVILWFIISISCIYWSNLKANNSAQLTRMMTIMTQEVIQTARDFAEIAEQWRSLAYKLNPESASEMEKIIQEYYKGKEQKEGKSKESWVKL